MQGIYSAIINPIHPLQGFSQIFNAIFHFIVPIKHLIHRLHSEHLGLLSAMMNNVMQ